MYSLVLSFCSTVKLKVFPPDALQKLVQFSLFHGVNVKPLLLVISVTGGYLWVLNSLYTSCETARHASRKTDVLDIIGAF